MPHEQVPKIAAHPDVSGGARVVESDGGLVVEFWLLTTSDHDVVLWEWGLVLSSGVVSMIDGWALGQWIPPRGSYTWPHPWPNLQVALVKGGATDVLGVMVNA